MDRPVGIHGGCQYGAVRRMPMAGPCRVDCGHRGIWSEYQDMKALHDEQRKIEREQAPYDPRVTDMDAWDAEHPPFTFQAFLIGRRAPERNER